MANIAELFLGSNQKSYSNPPNQALRIFAGANLNGFYFRIQDYHPHAFVAVDGNLLPDCYAGLRWNESTMTMHALARAARWIERNRPAARVAMTCVIQPGSQGQGRRQRWAT